MFDSSTSAEFCSSIMNGGIICTSSSMKMLLPFFIDRMRFPSTHVSCFFHRWVCESMIGIVLS